MREEDKSLIYQSIRSLEVEDKVFLSGLNSQHVIFQKVRFFAEVAGWDISCRTDKLKDGVWVTRFS